MVRFSVRAGLHPMKSAVTVLSSFRRSCAVVWSNRDRVRAPLLHRTLLM